MAGVLDSEELHELGGALASLDLGGASSCGAAPGGSPVVLPDERVASWIPCALGRALYYVDEAELVMPVSSDMGPVPSEGSVPHQSDGMTGSPSYVPGRSSPRRRDRVQEPIVPESATMSAPALQKRYRAELAEIRYLKRRRYGLNWVNSYCDDLYQRRQKQYSHSLAGVKRSGPPGKARSLSLRRGVQRTLIATKGLATVRRDLNIRIALAEYRLTLMRTELKRLKL